MQLSRPQESAMTATGMAAITASGDRLRIDSRALLGEHRTVDIAHGDAIYTLRLTRQGKLILTR